MRFCLLVLLLMMTSSSLSAQTPAPPAAPPTVLVEKPEFRALVSETATLEKLATDMRFLEGPAWNARTSLLTFSDIPASRLYHFDPAAPDAAPQVFRDPSEHANGNTMDAAGNLYTCEHGSRRVTRTSPDGTVAILAERFDGKLFSSPNDVVVKRDGTVWFSDPTYGLDNRPKEQTANRVYCLDPGTHEIHAVAEDFDQPNGLCFSPDEKRLYIADSGKPHAVRTFDVGPGNTLTGSRVFCVIEKGVPDGMRCDRDGNLWSTAGDGVYVYNPAGERLGKIFVPETPANLCFGGKEGNDLYLTAQKSLYRIKVIATSGSAAAGSPANQGRGQRPVAPKTLRMASR